MLAVARGRITEVLGANVRVHTILCCIGTCIGSSRPWNTLVVSARIIIAAVDLSIFAEAGSRVALVRCARVGIVADHWLMLTRTSGRTAEVLCAGVEVVALLGWVRNARARVAEVLRAWIVVVKGLGNIFAPDSSITGVRGTEIVVVANDIDVVACTRGRHAAVGSARIVVITWFGREYALPSNTITRVNRT